MMSDLNKMLTLWDEVGTFVEQKSAIPRSKLFY
jgi:hypothetical protein